MTKLPLTIKSILAAGIFSLLLFVGAVYAQEIQRTITLINPNISHQLNPGESAEGTTKIVNESSVPLTFEVGIQDYVVNDAKGTPQLLPPNTLNNKYSGASWIVASPNIFTLEPGATQVINYYLRVPADAKPGGHYAALVYEPVNQDQTEGTGGSINTQLGSLFYITVNGDVNINAQVSKFFTSVLHEFGPVKVFTELKNMSDLHIMPKGSITVTGLFFNESQSLEERNIFPETVRAYENTFGSMFMIGPYNAKLAASYGPDNNLPLVASFTFWVFPWKLALIVVLIIIAAVLGTMYWRRRQKTSPEASGEPENPTEK
jgi:hypothetical protein